MIRNCERLAVAAVETLQSEFFLDGDPALFAEQSIEMDRPLDGCDTVFREEYDMNTS